jgi:apolipoprotein N-acyltransferase
MVFIYTVVSRGIVCFMPLIFPFYWTLTLQLNRAANFTALFMLPLLLEGTILVLSTAVCLLALHRGTKKIILLQIIVIVTTGAASSAVIKYFNNRQDAAKNFECTFIQGGYSAKDYTLIEQYSELRLELAKRYVRHIEESPGSRLVIVPESALPIYQNREDPVIQSIQEIAVRKNQYIMTSLQLKEGKDVYNSMALVNPKGEIESVYRKRNIMPFVESDEYQKGRANITFNIDGYTIAPLICYDGVFVKNYFRDRRPDVYVVTSNDVFAEGTVLSRLLQAYSVINARTMGVSLLQVTQNGPSCYVDSRGKLRSLTEPYEQAIGLKVSLK